MGLPNLFPFKEQVLQTLARKKQQKEAEAKLKRLKNKETVDLKNAASRSAQFESEFTEAHNKNESDQEIANNEGFPKEKRKYMKELKKVLEASDVLSFFKANLNFS